MQWNHFRQTQLDSYSGHSISADRFKKATGWELKDLKDSWVLDVGCGAGRFAEVALDAGANVVALDYSGAVDACLENLKHHQKLHVIQGDIYALPFREGIFSHVYSLGVLQHTPDVSKAFFCLPPMLRHRGKLSVDYYELTWKSFFHSKYWFRPITKRLSKPLLFSILRKLVPILLPVGRIFGCIPIFGNILKRLVPVANYYGPLPLNDVQQLEWSSLDTFDWLSPEFDHPQRHDTIHAWMEQAGLKEIEVLKAGHLVGRGRKP